MGEKGNTMMTLAAIHTHTEQSRDWDIKAQHSSIDKIIQQKDPNLHLAILILMMTAF